MKDQYKRVLQSFQFLKQTLHNPSSLKVDHNVNSINDLAWRVNQYDIFLLDRNVLQASDSEKIFRGFKETLEKIGPKSEIISDSPLKEFRKIGKTYNKIIPINSLVRIKNEYGREMDSPYLLRIDNNKLGIWTHNSCLRTFIDMTEQINPNDLEDKIYFKYQKRDPLTIHTTLAFNRFIGKIPNDSSKSLMVGDRYLTSILAGNLAGIDTAKVKTPKPTTNKSKLNINELIDQVIGKTMNLIYERSNRA